MAQSDAFFQAENNTVDVELEERACPACGKAQKYSLQLGRGFWDIVQCKFCDFIYLDKIPSQEAFSDQFAWDQTFVKEKKRRKQKQPILQWIDDKTRWRLHTFPRPETREFLKRRVDSGPVLDVGCGDGGHAMKLSPDYVPFGVEIAPRLAAKANASFRSRGGKCLEGDAVTAISAFDDQLFTGVMMNSYLEHEFRPLEVLQSVRSKMVPNGTLIVKVPNAGSWNAKIMGRNWCGIRLPDHVNYFTWKTLTRMVHKAGFDHESPPFGTNLPTNDNMWIFLRPRQNSGTPL